MLQSEHSSAILRGSLQSSGWPVSADLQQQQLLLSVKHIITHTDAPVQHSQLVPNYSFRNIQEHACVQLPMYADSVALAAFNHHCGSNRPISPDHQVHSNKPTAVGLLLRAHAGRDRQTPDHYTDHAPHTMQAVSIRGKVFTGQMPFYQQTVS